ncbi:hypothetical protein Fraau_2384 [Frateuria aurantia DSM 6220]|uniref:Uncharacterized protein n=1 Tax=Frateuria aurantia (strain ATCC 33424 / DSM 6220 / KCTC 2777 / LMG 1558 / NBRC 3245 / NCIMB 13370) TaxID=767434 RepID=H8L607_FRAAD|nr:hypothetical protein Fraau_2384 [Frateuria aurantia DSM 6220]
MRTTANRDDGSFSSGASRCAAASTRCIYLVTMSGVVIRQRPDLALSLIFQTGPGHPSGTTCLCRVLHPPYHGTPWLTCCARPRRPSSRPPFVNIRPRHALAISGRPTVRRPNEWTFALQHPSASWPGHGHIRLRPLWWTRAGRPLRPQILGRHDADHRRPCTGRDCFLLCKISRRLMHATTPTPTNHN